MRFIKSSREGDWLFQIHRVKLMLVYFVTSGHRHYLCYATVYLIKMTKLPSDLLHKFFTGENDMKHCNGLWNSILSGMVIKTTIFEVLSCSSRYSRNKCQ